MDLKNLLSDDERAVSPVIGVILMVAITVILAAVIGAFVIGIGDDQSTVPQASWDISQNQQAEAGGDDIEITIAHNSGDTIDHENLEVTVDGDTVTEDSSGTGEWGVASGSDDQFTSEVSAGSSITIEEDSTDHDDFEGGETVRVVWESDDGGDSSILTSYEVN